MPQLDVSFVVNDPMLADTFKVNRYAEAIDTHGRSTTTATPMGTQRGVITQQDPADLIRRDDGQMVPRLIFVATTFALRSVATGYQPDVITWNGSDYKVKRVFSYSRFGKGIYEAIAESTQATNSPQ